MACISFLLLSLTASGPQPRRMTEQYFPEIVALEKVTPGLQKDKGFTRYSELIAFLEQLRGSDSTLVHLSYLGSSHKGKPIPWVRLYRRPQGGSKPIEVWMQGGLHGDEPASTEGLLYLLAQCARHWDRLPFSANIALNVVPMVNPDGYELQERENAQGLDLNRDQTKLMAAESLPLKRLMAQIHPHVAVDFHEYRPFRRDYVHLGEFGVCGAYDVMFLNSTHPNLPGQWSELRRTSFEKPLYAILDQNHITHHDYFTPEQQDGKTVFRVGSDNARSSSSNFALQGMLSTLVEVRGVGLERTSFTRRVYITYLVARTFLEQAGISRELLHGLRGGAQPFPDSIAIRSRRTEYSDSLTFLDIESNQPIRLPVVLEDARRQRITQKRSCPEAYAVSMREDEIIRRLTAFGLKADTLPAGIQLETESFVAATVVADPLPYEKVRTLNIPVRLVRARVSTPEPWLRFSMRQPRALIMPELLEPDAPNSLFRFSVVKTESNSTLPVYRIPK